MANRYRSIFSVVGLGLGVSLFGVTACSDAASDETAEPVGDIQLTIAEVPQDVQCVRLVVSGANVVEKLYSVNAGESSVFNVRAKGTNVTVLGDAHNTACQQITDLGAATWVAEPVATTLVSGSVTPVNLVFRRAGTLAVSTDFEDGTCVDGEQRCLDSAVREVCQAGAWVAETCPDSALCSDGVCTTSGVVACSSDGSLSCGLPTPCCNVIENGAQVLSCSDSCFQSTQSRKFSCDDPSDCATGTSCCLLGDPLGLRSECRASCTNSLPYFGAPVCDPVSPQCPSGTTCQQQTGVVNPIWSCK